MKRKLYPLYVIFFYFIMGLNLIGVVPNGPLLMFEFATFAVMFGSNYLSCAYHHALLCTVEVLSYEKLSIIIYGIKNNY